MTEYAQGGPLPLGYVFVRNGTGCAERVLTADELEAMMEHLKRKYGIDECPEPPPADPVV